MVLDDRPAARHPARGGPAAVGDVLEFELSANRPDLLGVWGIAREVSAVTGAPLCPPVTDEPAAAGQGSVDEHVALRVDAPDLCPRYMARVFTGVADRPVARSGCGRDSRRRACAPISNVVDVTNYVMLLTGQPLHAFDLDRIERGDGRRCGARATASGSPRSTASSGRSTRRCSRSATHERPAVIAGIFGAEFAEVNEATTRVLLEAANFDGPNMLATSWDLGLRTESSSRFEKGLPRRLPPVGDGHRQPAPRRAVRRDAGAGHARRARGAAPPAPIRMRHARASAILAMPTPADRSAEILRSLGCEVAEEPDALTVTVPFWRGEDLRREIDLIEEVGRHTGLDDIPAELPRLVAKAKRTPTQALRVRIARLAADLGFSRGDQLPLRPRERRRQAAPGGRRSAPRRRAPRQPAVGGDGGDAPVAPARVAPRSRPESGPPASGRRDLRGWADLRAARRRLRRRARVDRRR